MKIFNYNFDDGMIQYYVNRYKLMGIRSIDTLMTEWNSNDTFKSMHMTNGEVISQCITIKQILFTIVFSGDW